MGKTILECEFTYIPPQKVHRHMGSPYHGGKWREQLSKLSEDAPRVHSVLGQCAALCGDLGREGLATVIREPVVTGGFTGGGQCYLGPLRGDVGLAGARPSRVWSYFSEK
jgi:hypothetical protein